MMFKKIRHFKPWYANQEMVPMSCFVLTVLSKPTVQVNFDEVGIHGLQHARRSFTSRVLEEHKPIHRRQVIMAAVGCLAHEAVPLGWCYLLGPQL